MYRTVLPLCLRGSWEVYRNKASAHSDLSPRTVNLKLWQHGSLEPFARVQYRTNEISVFFVTISRDCIERDRHQSVYAALQVLVKWIGFLVKTPNASVDRDWVKPLTRVWYVTQSLNHVPGPKHRNLFPQRIFGSMRPFCVYRGGGDGDLVCRR